MIDSQYPTTDQLAAFKRGRSRFIWALFLLTISIVFGLIIVLEITSPYMPIYTKLGISIGVFVVFAIPVVIWMNPMLGLYFVYFMIMIMENDGRHPPANLPTTFFHFFININNAASYYGTNALDPVKFSPAEAIITLAFFSWLIRAIAKRELKFQQGIFLPVILLLMAWVTFGFIHGIATGGDFLLALWEVRAVYLFAAMYFITTNFVVKREQLKTFAWITVVGLSIRGLLGLYAYAQLAGHITDQGIIQHEDSLMFNILFFLPIILILNKGPKSLIWTAVCFVPIALFADLENNRRAGIAAFIIAFVAMLLIVLFLMPERRRQLGVFITLMTVVASIYLPAAWNAKGQWAFPAKAVRSQFDPDPRDASSDNYRMMEDYDLNFTRDTSPWIGVGYGKAWIEAIPLPQVTTGFLQFVAHDSVLWMWMRLGHIGFFIFMMLMAQVMIYGPQICRDVRDPVAQALGIIAILYMFMAFIYGKYDLQFANYRTMMALGVYLGILGNLRLLAAKPVEQTASADQEDSLPIEADIIPPLLSGGPSDFQIYRQ